MSDRMYKGNLSTGCLSDFEPNFYQSQRFSSDPGTLFRENLYEGGGVSLVFSTGYTGVPRSS